MRMKWLKWTAVGLSAVLVIAVAVVAWVLNAESWRALGGERREQHVG